MGSGIRGEHRREYCAAAGLILLGCIFRLAGIGALPFGLNQDEASAGYEAFALLTEGIDRCGKPLPVLFISWGSGQNVLMSYLALPFVALLGLSELSIRLPNAICGCLTLFVFWRMARRAEGPRFGLLALFLLVINPWHIMASRWALESNLLPFFLLAGVWCTSVARDRPWALLGASAAFGLSLYAYGTAFFFLPVYLVCAVLWLRRRIHWPSFLLSLALFLLLALPIALCQTANMLGWGELRLLGLTLPELTESRQTATSVFGGGGFSAAMENFRGFLSILWRGGDGLTYNALPLRKGGLLYFFGLPTAAVGFVGSLFLRKDRQTEAPMRIALVSALLCAFLIDCNVNRINMVWLPLIYFSALGCRFLFCRLRRWNILPLTAAVCCFCLFLTAYCDTFGGEGYVGYFPGLGGAVEAAEALGAETVYITDRVNQPYIFALFYGQGSPSDFCESVEYRDPDAAFRQVKRCAGFEFEDPAAADLLILCRFEAAGKRILAESGSFVVCEG